ncbi:hypothetical protein ASY01nite_14370 [Acetobacter syzygii]|uniref:hypothetical protein n=1 Tax=Acetobacter syzygii TaxID=146476 RepID=UPI0005DBF7B7|nr:hypothetical protein [Acetobacter syzygii]GAN72150.1 hypothetical protein Absy_030_058 [Acetobacter syzygii]GBR64996.1 hypothetical protein AA0483_1639 [Acetobacter syzygii NRIC 0483]GEL56371.1 hypothetical protein ASY01nite_14370 [Acetobacter syzygii]
MTQKTKLEIIGPYTPEHEGPFCTRDGRAARIICTDRKSSNGHSIAALVDDGDQEMNRAFNTQGKYCLSDRDFDLMNAREVPVAREFWVNEYTYGVPGPLHFTEESAAEWGTGTPFIRTIHVREVLPGEGA